MQKHFIYSNKCKYRGPPQSFLHRVLLLEKQKVKNATSILSVESPADQGLHETLISEKYGHDSVYIHYERMDFLSAGGVHFLCGWVEQWFVQLSELQRQTAPSGSVCVCLLSFTRLLPLAGNVNIF